MTLYDDLCRVKLYVPGDLHWEQAKCSPDFKERFEKIAKLSSLPASLSKGDEIPGAVTVKSMQIVLRPNAASGNSREEKEMKD